MYIVFPIRLNSLSDVMDILLVFYAGDPGSIPVEGNIFSSSILFFPFFIYFAKEFSSVLHKI